MIADVAGMRVNCSWRRTVLSKSKQNLLNQDGLTFPGTFPKAMWNCQFKGDSTLGNYAV